MHGKLGLRMDPLEPKHRSDGLVNIVSGQVVDNSSVEVEKVVTCM